MRLITKIGGCVVAGTLVAGFGPTAPAAATPATGLAVHRPATALAADQPFRTVTLITGDRLSVATNGSHDFAVIPTPGRENVTFVTNVVHDHVEVTPVDALPLVREGRLDSRLFDVTALLSYGYDDRRATLPLIVASRPGGSRRENRRRRRDRRRELPAVNGYAVEQSRAHATEFWNSLTTGPGPVPARLRDGRRQDLAGRQAQPTLDRSVPQIGAPAAWAAGLHRHGRARSRCSTPASTHTHPDLAGQVVAAQNFTDATGDDRRPGRARHARRLDHRRHRRGVRRQVQRRGARTRSSRRQGAASTYGCAESWILAGMQWAAEQARQGGQHEPRRRRHPGRRPARAGGQRR